MQVKCVNPVNSSVENNRHFIPIILWWPRELDTLQLKKTYVNWKTTSKLRKPSLLQHMLLMYLVALWVFVAFSVFGCVVSISSVFCIWLHCEYLQRFLYLVVLWVFAAFSVFGCIVSICSVFCIWLRCEYLQRFLYLVALWVFAAFSVFGCVVSICSVSCIWLCCEYLQCFLYLVGLWVFAACFL